MDIDFFSEILGTPVGCTIDSFCFDENGCIKDLRQKDVLSFYLKGGSIHINIISSLRENKQDFINLLVEIEDAFIRSEYHA